jgi:hypothetical protein
MQNSTRLQLNAFGDFFSKNRISVKDAVEAVSFYWAGKNLGKIKRTMPLKDRNLDAYGYLEPKQRALTPQLAAGLASEY